MNTFYDLKKAYEREIEWCFDFGFRNLNNKTIWKKIKFLRGCCRTRWERECRSLFFSCVPCVTQTENIYGSCYCVMLSVYFVTAFEGDDCDENVAPVYSASMQRGMAEDNWDINNGMVNQ